MYFPISGQIDRPILCLLMSKFKALPMPLQIRQLDKYYKGVQTYEGVSQGQAVQRKKTTRYYEGSYEEEHKCGTVFQRRQGSTI